MPNTEVKPYVPKILADFSAGKIGRRQFFCVFLRNVKIVYIKSQELYFILEIYFLENTKILKNFTKTIAF